MAKPTAKSRFDMVRSVTQRVSDDRRAEDEQSFSSMSGNQRSCLEALKVELIDSSENAHAPVVMGTSAAGRRASSAALLQPAGQVELLPMPVGLGDVKQAASATFGYARPCIVAATHGDAHAPEDLATEKAWQDVFSAWGSGAATRREKVARELSHHAVGLVQSDDAPSRMLGIEQLFELAAQGLNLASVRESGALEAVTKCLRDPAEAPDVRLSAAMLVWRLSSMDSYALLLIGKSHVVHEALFELAKALGTSARRGGAGAGDAAGGQDDIGNDNENDNENDNDNGNDNNTENETGATDDDRPTANLTPAVERGFVTAGEPLRGAGPAVATLLALFHFEICREWAALAGPDGECRLVALARLAGGSVDDTAAARSAAEGVLKCVALLWRARVAFAHGGGLRQLALLCRARATEVVKCGCVSLNLYARDMLGRKLISAEDAAFALKETVTVCRWALRELEQTKPAESEIASRRMQRMRNEGIVPEILSHAAAAMWGCAVVVRRERAFVLLAGDMEWFDTAMDLAAVSDSSDSRVNGSVGIAGAGVLAVLAQGLAGAMLAHKPDTVLVLLKVGTESHLIHAREGALAGLSQLTRGEGHIHDRARNTLIEAGALEKLSALIDDDTGTLIMEKHAAAAMMHLTAMPGRRFSRDQLRAAVGLLTRESQLVLSYGAYAVWALARDRANRAALGELWAVDGLKTILDIKANLPLKTMALAALWLLACEPRNAVRVAVRGALQLAAGVIRFPLEPCYAAVRTVAIGLVLQLVSGPDSDVHNLLETVSIATPLVSVLADTTSSAYSRCMAMQLLFRLRHSEACASDTEAAAGHHMLERAAVGLAASEHPDEQIIGVFCITSLAMRVDSKIAIGKAGGIEALAKLLKSERSPSEVLLKVLHALLNLSTHASNQVELCSRCLDTLLRATRDEAGLVFTDTHAQFARSILANLSNNVTCRSKIMFKHQLRIGSEALTGAKGEVMHFDQGGAMRGGGGGGGGGGGDDLSALHGGSVAGEKSYVSGASTLKTRFTSWMAHSVAHDGSVAVTASTARKTTASATASVSASQTASADQLNTLRAHIRTGVSSLWEGERLDLAAGPADGAFDLGTRSYVSSGSRLGDGSIAASRTTGRVSTAPSGARRSVRTPGARSVRTPGGAPPRSLLGSRSGVLSRPSTSPNKRPGSSSASHMSSMFIVHDTPHQLAMSMRPAGRPDSPLRSSHRIGPIGQLGSVPIREGESRWTPKLVGYFRTPHAAGKGAGTDVPAAEAAAAAPRPSTAPAGASRKKSTAAVPAAAAADGDRRPPKPNAKPGAAARLGGVVRQRDGSTSRRRPSARRQELERLQNAKMRTATLEPSAVYNTVHFNGPPRMSGAPVASPVTLCKFKHVPGSQVGAGLFDPYQVTLDDGTTEACYFYHTSAVVCEALDPGELPVPPEPLSMAQVLCSDQPMLPSVPVPKGGDEAPRIVLPLPPVCPPINRHAIPLCMLSGIYGGIPAQPMPLVCRMEAKVVEAAKRVEEVAKVWTLPDSVFKPRAKESDSRDFWDNESMEGKAIVCDFTRLCGEPRFRKFVEKNDEEVQRKEQEIQNELDEIKAVFAPVYMKFLRMFDYYCLVANTTGESAFCMSQNAYYMLMEDCKVPNAACTIEEIGQIFVVVNFETDEQKASGLADVNMDKALMRHELLEALVRIAIERFGGKGACGDVSECVQHLIEETILPNLPTEAKHDPNDFRRNRMYFEPVDLMLKAHMKPLKLVYSIHCELGKVAGKARFGLSEWLLLVKAGGLLGHGISARECRLAFYFSRMLVIDEVKSRHRAQTLSFVEFLEALCRLADMFSVPSDEDLAKHKAVNPIDWLIKLKALDMEEEDRLRKPRPSSAFLAPKTRSLQSKLDWLLKLMFGRLAILNKGRLQHGKATVALVPTYLTDQQLRTVSVDSL